MKRGILFDLDGTLWDSALQVADSWALTLQERSDVTRKPSVEEIQSVMGKVTEEIADLLFPELSCEKRLEVIEDCLKQENAYILEHGGNLFEGAREVLEELKRRQYHLYIVSNCQVGYIEAFLTYYGLETYFDDYESYGRTRRPKGENIRLVADRNQLDLAVYVGDTQGDYEAAKAAGLPFIHARTGYGRIDGDIPAIDSLSQLAGLLEGFWKEA